MRCILVCPDDFLWRLVAGSGEPRLDPLYLVESARARTRIAQRGGDALTGDLERDGLYRRAFRTGHEPVLLAVERARQVRIVAAIRRVAPTRRSWRSPKTACRAASPRASSRWGWTPSP